MRPSFGRFVATFRTEWWLLRQHPTLSVAPALVIILAAACTVGPVLVDGRDQTLGLLGWQEGAVLGATAACAIGPVLALMLVGNEIDLGLRRVRFLSAQQPTTIAAAEIAAAFTALVILTGAVAAMTFLFGAGDLAVRTLTGNPASTVPSLGLNLLGTVGIRLAAAFAFTLVAAAVVYATGSGARGTLTLTIVIASWFGLLLRVRTGLAHDLLALHPASFAWSQANPFPARALATARPELSLLSFGTWLVLLAVLAYRRLKQVGIQTR